MTIFTSRNGVEPYGPGDDDDGDGGGTGDVKSERYGAKTEFQPQSGHLPLDPQAWQGSYSCLLSLETCQGFESLLPRHYCHFPHQYSPLLLHSLVGTCDHFPHLAQALFLGHHHHQPVREFLR